MRSTSMQKMTEWLDFVPGMIFCVILASSAAFLSQNYGGPAVLYGLLLGMPFHFLSQDARLASGIQVASRDILRVGVALLGARITIEQVVRVGAPTMLAVIASIGATIIFGWMIARRAGLPTQFGILTAGATAICGASAAAAISSVLPRYKNIERDTAFTIIGVTTLSTFAMVVYPALSLKFGLSHDQTGILIGATIHDVAQVVGAGYSVSAETGDKATIVKLFRVALLLPVVVTISLVGRRATGKTGQRQGALIPWFLVGFAALVAANSAGLVPHAVGSLLGDVSRWCIIVAIVALGVKTALKSFAEVGRTAVVMMVAETLFLAILFLTLLLTAV